MSDEEALGLPPLVVPAADAVPPDAVDVFALPEVAHGLLLVLPLLGVWRGAGVGDLGDGDLAFDQQLTFAHDGRDVLAYESIVWAAGDPAPVVRERGWWRPRPSDGPDSIEAVIAHDDGTVEVSIGAATGTRFELTSDVIVRTGGDPVRLHRLFGLVGGDLMYAWDRAVGDQPARPYLSARLRRVSATSRNPG